MATIPLKAKHLPALRQRTFSSFAVKVMACLFLPLFVLSRSLFAGNTGNNPGNENGSSPEVREILCNATINYPGSPFCNGLSPASGYSHGNIWRSLYFCPIRINHQYIYGRTYPFLQLVRHLHNHLCHFGGRRMLCNHSGDNTSCTYRNFCLNWIYNLLRHFA